MKKFIILAGLVLIGLIICVAFGIIYYPQIVTKMIADKNKISVTYTSVSVQAFDRFLFKQISVVDNKSGWGVNAEEAIVRLSFMPRPDWINGIKYECKGAQFTTAGAKTAAGFDSLNALASAPFSGIWKYSKFSGDLKETKDGADFKGIIAESTDLRFQIDGKMYGKSQIACDITVYFNERLLGKTPSEVTSMFLEKGKSGWVGMPVHIEGDFKTTNFNISSKRFRLSITPK